MKKKELTLEEKEAEELLLAYGKAIGMPDWSREMQIFKDRDKYLMKAWLAVRKKAIEQEERRAMYSFVEECKRRFRKQE
jgi:hypothetical protein